MNKTADEVDENGKKRRNMKLVIVESPAKASTIKKILGSEYQIKASVGHIRDLPKSKLGIDIEGNFEPQYQILDAKKDVVQDLQEAAERASEIFLAPDPDREGEAIAWHLAHIVGGYGKPVKRIEFHEITKTAIQAAILNPREINTNKVNAQQARRVLDRLVGYKLSPLLWKKVSKGLSAGRVQSVAVRLICEREEEVLAFIPVEYWTIHAKISPKAAPTGLLDADLNKVNGKKPEISNEAEAMRLKKIIETSDLVVKEVKERKSTRQPSPPFITSSLQREASNKFGYTVKKTMQIAQRLYEGLDIAGKTEGLITYMRTDSTRIADEAQAEAKEFILKRYGKDYYPEVPRTFEKKGKKNVQ
ncbi:MAG: type I DNA topoisomerase, partial [Myxococcaceae bacterium]